MHKHRDITLRRLEDFARRFQKRIYAEARPVNLSTWQAPGRVAVAEALKAKYSPIKLGHQFGPHWSTHWVRLQADIPAEWKGREVHLRWESNSEAGVWHDGKIQQGLSGQLRPEYRLTKKAKGGEKIELHIEVAVNHLFGVGVAGSNEGYPLGRLDVAEIALYEPAAWDTFYDYIVIAELAKELDPASPRGGQALRVANDMVNIIDLDDPTTWKKAREIAREFLSEKTGGGAHNLSAIGHAHIDTAWLWPLAESKRKCYRSFASQLLNLEEYPEYKFVVSQAQQWDWMRREQPELHARMMKFARKGRFIPVGGTWIEPDCNIPSGESLVRQFLYGQRYFKREFGAQSDIFWNPDVFGYSGQLPQIMAGAGIRYFLTQKLSWSQFNKMPSHTFYWEGIDGTKLLSHFPPVDTYNAVCTVKEILFNVRNFKDHEKSRESYYLFGIGDGGGGPTRDMIERLRRMEDLDGLPKVTTRTPNEFFQRLEADAKDLLTWVGELYLEYHRGTFTTQAKNKLLNRRSELALRDIEMLYSMTDIANYPKQDIDHCWEIVLLNQFHDIIPGSSITPVYEDSMEQYAEIGARFDRLITQRTKAIAGKVGNRVLAINTLSAPRREVVALPKGVKGAQTSAAGEQLAIVSAPALGYTIAAPENPPATVKASENKSTITLENDFLLAVFNKAGRLTRLYDKENHREILAPGEAGNNLLLFDDNPITYEAWDVDIYHLEKFQQVAAADSAKILETGPVRARVEFSFPVGKKSRVVCIAELDAISRRLNFHCTADWHEEKVFLKVEFPFDIRAMNATYEIQFGHLERPTHSNTTWDMAKFEVCAHRWADLSEPDYGVALLNDCKYGYSTLGNRMRLSLLRSPKEPDPTADMGSHKFSYAIYPHAGPLAESDTIEEAARFNSPLHLLATDRPVESHSWVTVEGGTLAVDTVKRAEDSDDVVVRLYETRGRRGTAALALDKPIRKAAWVNLLEGDLGKLDVKSGAVEIVYTPFQIITLKLRV